MELWQVKETFFNILEGTTSVKSQENAQSLELPFIHEVFTGNKVEVMNQQQPPEQANFLGNLKSGIWLVGISSWIFGITDRSIASFSDGYLSALDVTQLFTASFFFVSWLFLKPTSRS